jgi:signal peptide peptidase SppA
MFFKKKSLVAHIRLSGVIGNVGRFQQGLSYASHHEIIEKAFALKKIKAVAITINSPGGSPVQSHLLYSLIRKLADEKKVKVITFAEDVAASGGYMLACAGDEIYANPSSIIGSIGVIYSGFGFQELIKKMGVERRVHTAGKSKSILDPFVDEKPEDIQKLKAIQEDLHKEFINLVKNSRKEKIQSQSDEHLFTGEFWSGRKAKDLGLVDGIGNAFQVLQDQFGKDVKIKKFEKAEGWLKKRLSSSVSSATSAAFNEMETRSFWNKFGL